MPALLSKSSLVPGQFSLKPGSNRVGRAAGNEILLNHPSVSSRHAEIVVEGDSLLVRDLGSTNGTFIDREAIQESFIRPGQTLHFGGMELVCLADNQPAVTAQAATGLRVAKHESANEAESPTMVIAAPEVMERKMPPRPPMVQQQVYRTFFQRLPGAFSYPFKSDGLILLIAGTVFFVVLDFLGAFSLWVAIIGFGYLAAFMQKIIASSAQGEEDLPGWPEFSSWWEDILHPALLLAGTFIASFGPALGVWFFLDVDPAFKLMLAIALGAFGCLYLPMALLTVSMYESIMAVNPLLIVPSMVKVPGAYIVTCIVLAFLLAARTGINAAIGMVEVPILTTVIAGFVSLYFLTVEMRILGILYHDKKDELNWAF